MQFTGEYIVLDTMEGLNPNFAIFQGNMIYSDNAISPVINFTNRIGGEYIGTWVNNPTKDFIAFTLDEFRYIQYRLLQHFSFLSKLIFLSFQFKFLRANGKQNHGDD